MAGNTIDPNTFAANALQIAAQPILDALVKIQANPTTLNIAAQGVALQGNLIAVAPALETLGISDVAALLHQKLTDALASALAAPSVIPPPAPNSAPNSAPDAAPLSALAAARARIMGSK